MKSFTVLFLVYCCTIVTFDAFAEVPRLINYQGTITDSNGPVHDTHTLTFIVYPDSTSVIPLWVETHSGEEINYGLFNVILGSTNPFPDSLMDYNELWMGVKVDSDSEIIPRMRITSVPWALRAAKVDTAEVALNCPQDTFCLWETDGTSVYRLNGNVGIGTSSTEKTLHIYKETSSTTSPQEMLLLHSVSTGDYNEYSDFGPQITFRSVDSDGNGGDDYDFASISGVHYFSTNYGKINFDVMCNGGWRRLVSLSDPDGPDGIPNGLSINEPNFNRGVISVRNFNANEYVAYFESEIPSEHNMLIAYTDVPVGYANFLEMKSNTASSPDTKFRFNGDGNAYADGAWYGGGADYAEWFEKEEGIPSGSLIGLNIDTGKMRVWRPGDPFMGVHSTHPGFVCNNIAGAEINKEALEHSHVLVSLIGQVEIKSRDIVKEDGKIFTRDGQFIGWLLANGKVFVRYSGTSGYEVSKNNNENTEEIIRLRKEVRELQNIVHRLLGEQNQQALR